MRGLFALLAVVLLAGCAQEEARGFLVVEIDGGARGDAPRRDPRQPLAVCTPAPADLLVDEANRTVYAATERARSLPAFTLLVLDATTVTSPSDDASGCGGATAWLGAADPVDWALARSGVVGAQARIERVGDEARVDGEGVPAGGLARAVSFVAYDERFAGSITFRSAGVWPEDALRDEAPADAAGMERVYVAVRSTPRT